MENYRTRICICYLITSFLISTFVYVLISSNLQNNRAIGRLREEVDEIAHLVLHTAPGGERESKQLNDVVDGILKKRLAGIWDDIYTVKKQLKASECATLGRRKQAVDTALEERINYAAEELGAKIHSVEAEPVAGTNIIKSLLRLDFSANPPVMMLRQSLDPGNCFAFKGNSSAVTVKLAKEIFVESIEYEHITSAHSPTTDISSAPKTFAVYGKPAENAQGEHLLGEFEYDNSAAQRVQQFAVQTILKCHLVRFKFETNYGNPNYTCIYRIAVYGKM